MLLAESADCILELGQAHVVCRRIDEVARQRDRFDDALEVFAIELCGRSSLTLRFALCDSAMKR